jgi:hypothetical protein
MAITKNTIFYIIVDIRSPVTLILLFVHKCTLIQLMEVGGGEGKFLDGSVTVYEER